MHRVISLRREHAEFKRSLVSEEGNHVKFAPNLSLFSARTGQIVSDYHSSTKKPSYFIKKNKKKTLEQI